MNILELGLNVDSFDENKKKKLQEFIALFDTLSKYEGRVWNPVMGGGFIEFNKSLTETNKLLDELDLKIKQVNSSTLQLKGVQTSGGGTKTQIKDTQVLVSEYDKLKTSLKEQAATYRELYLTTGKNSAQTKAALVDYRNTSSAFYDMNRKIGDANGSAKLFGGSLATAFGHVRNLAYILPGLGIAGIFNLAFQAIAAAASELDIFKDKLSEQIKFETQLNDHLKEQFDIYKSLISQQEKLTQTTDTYSSSAEKRRLAELKSSGLDKVSLSAKEVALKETTLKEAATKAGVRGGSIEANKAAIQILINEQTDVANKIKTLNAILDDPEYKKNAAKLASEATRGVGGAGGFLPAWAARAITDFNKPIDEQLKKQKSSLLLQQDINEEQLKNLTNYIEADSSLRESQLSNQKVLEDEKRKLFVETSKEELSVAIERNRAVLSKETSTLKQRELALKNIENLEIRVHDIEKRNVTENISATPTERAVAEAKARAENIKSVIKYHEQIEKEETIFYQKHLKAVTETQKAELEEQAIANEKIANNQEKSLNERLEATNKYITIRQKIQDLEFNMQIQAGASKLGGKTALTSEQVNQFRAQNLSQQANIQADAEKKVYDIVYQSTQKQLKLIVDTNKLYESSTEQEYEKEVELLNNSLEKKSINYTNYKKKKEIIDEKYKIQSADAAIRDDKFEIGRLSDFLEEQKNLRAKAYEEMQDAKDKLETQESIGNKDLVLKKDYDTRLGIYNAYNAAILNSDEELKKVQDKLRDDKNKKIKAEFDLLNQLEREHAENRKQIEEGIFNLVTTYIDAEAQKRIDKLELQKQSTDEAYDSEISAIEKSSLSSKDKAALDIQLNEQKKEYDKETDKQERKLKHDQAVIDRSLVLARIAWETEQAIMTAYSTYGLLPGVAEGLAFERGILGAIAAATVLATDIPAYKIGTKDHPGGLARYGEIPEIIKEPYKSPYLVLTETVSKLPKGTEVIPIKDSPEFTGIIQNNSWEQTRWLAKQLRKNKQEIKNIINPVVNIDMSTIIWAKQILGN